MSRRLAATVVVLLSMAGFGRPARTGDSSDSTPPDVRHYDIDVVLRDASLAETVTVYASAAKAPKRWTLELAPQMKIVSADCGGRAMPIAVNGWTIEVDLSGAQIKDATEFVLTFHVEGAPLEENKRMGFTRSAVRPDVAYIRSQYPWYPRASDDLATYRTRIDAPARWLVRTAGTTAGPERKAERAVWSFHRATAVFRIGLAAAPYVRIDGLAETGSTVNAYVLPGHERAADSLIQTAKRALAFYTSRFGAAVDTSWTLVEMPKEFGTGSGYGEAGYVLLGDSAFATEGAEWTREFVAHEIAHGWWANTVRFSDFANEALANWSAMTFLAETADPAVAAEMRRVAVARIGELSASGKEIALRDLKGFGESAGPGVYAVLAYQKGLMLLTMAEQRIGSDAMRGVLSTFVADHRTDTTNWTAVRSALSAASPDAAALLDAWDAPGVPTLRVDFQAKKSGDKWTVTGKVTQEGTPKPRPMWVPVVATCGDKTFVTTVTLKAASATFTLTTPSEPDGVVLDPDCLVLARKPTADKATLSWDEVFAIVNNPRDSDPEHCAQALASLRAMIASGKCDKEGQAWVGVGRLLFRTGKLDDAKTSLEKALKIGGFGAFNRSWAMLRLGCIADLSRKRNDAIAQYKAVVDLKGADEFVVKLAKRWLEQAYRGYDKDG